MIKWQIRYTECGHVVDATIIDKPETPPEKRAGTGEVVTVLIDICPKCKNSSEKERGASPV